MIAPAEGADGRVHFAHAGTRKALCGKRTVEDADTHVGPGGWIGRRSTNCLPCIKAALREGR